MQINSPVKAGIALFSTAAMVIGGIGMLTSFALGHIHHPSQVITTMKDIATGTGTVSGGLGMITMSPLMGKSIYDYIIDQHFTGAKNSG